MTLHDTTTTSTGQHFSVIQLTQGESHGVYGSRIASLWFYKTGNVFEFSIDTYNEDFIYTPYDKRNPPYELNHEYNIHMQTESAVLDGNQIHKTWISVDGVLVGVVYNHKAQVLNDVKVYCGGPWHDVFDATIKDLEYGSLSSTGLTQGDQTTYCFLYAHTSNTYCPPRL